MLHRKDLLAAGIAAALPTADAVPIASPVQAVSDDGCYGRRGRRAGIRVTGRLDPRSRGSFTPDSSRDNDGSLFSSSTAKPPVPTHETTW
jgi:hypothetical protein